MPTISDFPILAREWRARFRGDQTFLLLAVVSIGVAWAMIHRLNDEVGIPLSNPGVSAFAPLSQELLIHLVWTQILGICLLAPLHSAPLIARERESGISDDLLLTSLSPWRLVLEKWVAGGLFLLLVLLALWPLNLVALLMGNSPPSELGGIALLGVGCLMWGDALGIAFSAHARRAAGALRSALAVALAWLIGSLVAGVMSGEVSFIPFGGLGVPPYITWLGRTNPILCAFDILQPAPFLTPKWPYCAGFLVGSSCLLLCWAVWGVRKPLPDLPIIAPKRGQRGGVSGALSLLEMPMVGRFAPSNPVLGREARGKFRLRQPPKAVLISEIVLGLGVVAFYLLLVNQAITVPASRFIIFSGITWTGFFVSVLAASALGGTTLARERENKTWESLQLSLLSPTQIVRGKLVAALATSLVLSLPAWPLIMLCVNWRGDWMAVATPRSVEPFQFVGAFLVWLGMLWLQTLLGMLISTRARKAGGAVMLSVGVALIWMLGPLALFLNYLSPDSNLAYMALVNPLVAFSNAVFPSPPDLWASTGWPFALFALVVGIFLLLLIEAEVKFQQQHIGQDEKRSRL